MKEIASSTMDWMVLVLWAGIITLVLVWVLMYIRKKKQLNQTKYPFLKSLANKEVTGTVEFYFETPEREKIQFLVKDTNNKSMEILNEELEKGSHIVSFDTTNVPDGGYYYCLISNGFKTERYMEIKNND